MEICIILYSVAYLMFEDKYREEDGRLEGSIEVAMRALEGSPLE